VSTSAAAPDVLVLGGGIVGACAAYELARPGARVEVIDVSQRPELAERERIDATPALVRVSPEPRVWIAGDLSDWSQVGLMLDLRPDEMSASAQGATE